MSALLIMEVLQPNASAPRGDHLWIPDPFSGLRLIWGQEPVLNRVTISQNFRPGLVVELPAEDLPILAGAVGSGCTHLWTGDKRYFGRWYGKSLEGVVVLDSNLLARQLLDDGW